MKKKIVSGVEEVGWWLLNKSGIFRILFRRFLITLCFELERFDIEPEEIKKKYQEKLKKYS